VDSQKNLSTSAGLAGVFTFPQLGGRLFLAGFLSLVGHSCRYVYEREPQLAAAVLAGTIRAAAAEAEAKRLTAEKEHAATGTQFVQERTETSLPVLRISQDYGYQILANTLAVTVSIR
jgi:hypothetical protein